MVILRLLHIASFSQSLAPSALQLALQQLTETPNVSLYVPTVSDYNNLPSISESLPVDTKWVEETTAKNASERNRLEVELKQYTSNMIKESIRVSG